MVGSGRSVVAEYLHQPLPAQKVKLRQEKLAQVHVARMLRLHLLTQGLLFGEFPPCCLLTSYQLKKQ